MKERKCYKRCDLFKSDLYCSAVGGDICSKERRRKDHCTQYYEVPAPLYHAMRGELKAGRNLMRYTITQNVGEHDCASLKMRMAIDKLDAVKARKG